MSVLYFVKYAVLYTGHPILLSFLYVFTTTGIIILIGNIDEHFRLFNLNFIKNFSIAVCLIVLLYIIFFPRMGEIGRYPAIIDWIERFKAGEYPCNSPHTPSSYPVIFLLAYPFYFIGNICLLEFIGAALFFFFVFNQEDTPRGISTKIVILLTCLVFYYEIVTRSELFFNMMLITGVVFFSEKYLDTQKLNKWFFFAGILTGFVLATRSVAALLFMIYYLYRFRYDFKNLFLLGLISISVFALFIIPLYIWDPESFMKNGPFAVQSYLSNLPFIIIILFFALALVTGWLISDVQEFFFSGGIILFLAALISFLLRVSDLGFSHTLYKDGYDIAYFIFCVPLLLLSIKDYKTDRFLGKVY